MKARRPVVVLVVVMLSLMSGGSAVKASGMACGTNASSGSSYYVTDLEFNWNTLHWFLPVRVNINWGDGSSPEYHEYYSAQGSDTTSHTYPGPGTYALVINFEDDVSNTCSEGWYVDK